MKSEKSILEKESLINYGMNKKINLFFVVFSFYGYASIGQESANTTGGDILNSNGTVSYSIGQVFFESQINSSVIVSQGVQQPYEIYDITSGLNENLNISINVFPNPTSDYIKVQIENGQKKHFSYSLYDNIGNTIVQGEIINNEAVIDMKSLSPAIYFVQIENKSEKIKTFKIIKK